MNPFKRKKKYITFEEEMNFDWNKYYMYKTWFTLYWAVVFLKCAYINFVKEIQKLQGCIL